MLRLFDKDEIKCKIKIKINKLGKVTAMKRNGGVTPEFFKSVRKSLRAVEMDRYVFVLGHSS